MYNLKFCFCFCFFILWGIEMSVVVFSLLLVVYSHVIQSTDKIGGYLIWVLKANHVNGYGWSVNGNTIYNELCLHFVKFPGGVLKALLDCACWVFNRMQIFFQQWLRMVVSCNVLRYLWAIWISGSDKSNLLRPDLHVDYIKMVLGYP